MQHIKRLVLIAGLASSVIVPFLLHAQQGNKLGSMVMTAASFQPGKGWTSAAAQIPGLYQKIFYIIGSGGTGSTSWAFGFDDNNNYNMAVSTGNGVWSTAVAVPPALGSRLMFGFLPAYPDTGTPTNGWLQGGLGISYFNGTNFSPPSTFGSNPSALQAYASQGVGWALVNQQGVVGVSTFDTTNTLTNNWSPVKALPLPIMQSESPSISFPAAASQGLFYILGFQSGQASVMVVDRTNTVHVYPIPFSATQAPMGGFLFAYGNNVEALLFVSSGSGAQTYSYLSTDSGQHWTNTSKQMPPLLGQMSIIETTFANGVVVIPLSLSGPMNQIRYTRSAALLVGAPTSTATAPGVFIDLKHKSPLWLPYPAPNFSNDAGIIAIWSQLSSDGTEQCVGLSDNTFGCYNFSTNQWYHSQAIPSGQSFSTFGSISFFDNNQIAAAQIGGANALYYDGNSWTAQPITNMNGGIIGLSTRIVEGTYYTGISPNALWAFGVQ